MKAIIVHLPEGHTRLVEANDGAELTFTVTSAGALEIRELPSNKTVCLFAIGHWTAAYDEEWA